MNIEHEATVASGRHLELVSPASQGESLRVGAIVADKYKLLKQLGKGGMGEVWRAEHRDLRTEVAIKFVYETLAQHASFGGTALERFRFEAQVAARLAPRSKHVVAVYDTGTFNGCPFLVMELVPGHTLEAEVERKGTLSAQRFADILDQVADAVDAAHALGIAHRDIKPPNILLIDQPDGSVLAKVADFGVAKALLKDIPLDKPKETMMGELVGSPAYMSPEQVSGKSIGPETDIWSLGVVAFEALTGKLCFECTSLGELMSYILARPTPALTEHRPDLPRSVDAWLSKAMAKEPSDRFGSVREMANAFRATLKPAPTPGRSAGLVALGALGIGLAALVVGATVSLPPSPLTAQAAIATTPLVPAGALTVAADPPSADPSTMGGPEGGPPKPPRAAVADRQPQLEASNKGSKGSVAPPAPSPQPSSPATPSKVEPPVDVAPKPPAPLPAPKPPPKRIDPSEIQ